MTNTPCLITSLDPRWVDDRQDADHLDTMWKTRRRHTPAVLTARIPARFKSSNKLREQAATLKDEIAKVGALVVAHRAEDANPAVMLLLPFPRTSARVSSL